MRRSATPLAVVDASGRIVAGNRPLAAMLEIEEAALVTTDLLSMFVPEVRTFAASILAGIAGGVVDSCQGRGALILRSGKRIDVLGWARAVGEGSEHTLVALVPADERAPEPPAAVAASSPSAFAVIDHDWRLSEISLDAAQVLGWDVEEYLGRPLPSVVHGDDVPLLLLGLARSDADRRARSVVVHVATGSGDWRQMRLEVSPLCNHKPPRFAVALRAVGAPEEAPEERVSRLEEHLWRIALEARAAGIGAETITPDVSWRDPELRNLSRRQVEILQRLVQGERVPGIAEELFLSQSTVRNHLVAIYRKLGVHSQPELLSRLRRSAARPRPSGQEETGTMASDPSDGE